MEKHAEDARRKAMVIDIDMLVPKDHLLRKIEKVMDYDWLYERLNPLYNDKVGRPGTDPVVLIKMVLIQHLFGIPSLRQTWRECDVNVAYRWFLGYDLLEHIPHFATVSYAFCNRFPAELSVEIFDHILNKALNNRMVDPSVVFIDGTHIKASANKKKFQKEQVNKAAKVYDEVLRKEVNEERAKLGKKEIEDKDDDEPPKGEKTVSTTDPDCGMFVKGEHERQFAYEAHTACERHGFVLAVEVTPGNIHDSVAWDAVYDSVCSRFPEAEALAMDAGYKTPWIARKILRDELCQEWQPGAVAITGNDAFAKDSEKDPAVIIRTDIAASRADEDIRNLAQSVVSDSSVLAIFCVNEASATGILSATSDGLDLDRTNGKYKDLIVIGFDSGSTLNNAVRSGYFYGAVAQDPYTMGYEAMMMAINVLQGGEASDIVIPAVWFDASNMDDPEISRILYD